MLRELYDAAVAGAAPGPLVRGALEGFETSPQHRLWLYAVGKGAQAMATAAASVLRDRPRTITGGVVVAPEYAPPPHDALIPAAGDHPVPGRRSFAAAERIGRVATGTHSGDVALVLLSGGASSLIAAPLRGMSEADLAQLFELLLGSGLDIHAMNMVRKRFTRWGAGRLALALAPARTHVFVISDVPGDDPADVGSGPCAPDPHRANEVIALLHSAGIYPRLGTAMRDHLTAVARGLMPETPKPAHPAFAHVSTHLIGFNRLAVDAVLRHAGSLSIPAERGSMPLQGEAAGAGETIARVLLERARQGARGCVVWGGETTVTLSDSPTVAGRVHGTRPGALAAGAPPRGGRCQELALAAARLLAETPDVGARITLLAAGTDGRDGPTDAAGAYADASIWNAILRAGQDPAAALAHHESYAALDVVDALLRCGLTGTNVMDVVIGLVE